MKLIYDYLYKIKDFTMYDYGLIIDNVAVWSNNEKLLNSNFIFNSNNIHNDLIYYNGYTLYHVNNMKEIYFFICSNDDKSKNLCKLIGLSLENMLSNDKEESKENILKNVLLGNSSINIKENDNHDYSSILLTSKSPINEYSSLIKSIFKNETIIQIDDYNIVIVLKIIDLDSFDILNILISKISKNINISVGSTVKINNIKKSYNEALETYKINKILNNWTDINYFKDISLELLLNSLDKEASLNYLNTNVNNYDLGSLDQELLFTIQKFFDNNLSVSETSRQLFLHRNTLIYRLEKIKKITGLDIQNFNDALTLKLSLLIQNLINGKRA